MSAGAESRRGGAHRAGDWIFLCDSVPRHRVGTFQDRRQVQQIGVGPPGRPMYLLLCPGHNGSHRQPAKWSLPATGTSKSNLISRRNFSLQVLEHRQMHLDHHAGQDSDVFVIVSGQNRIQESLLDVQQLLLTDDLTLNIGDVKELA
jgi:hypothetical protein